MVKSVRTAEGFFMVTLAFFAAAYVGAPLIDWIFGKLGITQIKA